LSLLGDQAAVVALALRLTDAGARPWTVGALLIAGLAPLVVLAPLAGRLIDTVDSRRLLVVAGSVQALLCLALATVSGTAATLALVAALGCFESVTGSTWQALLPSLVSSDELPRAMGLSQAGGTIASIAAPVAGGVLAGRFGTAMPLVLDALTYLAVVIGALFVHTRREPRAEPRAEPAAAADQAACAESSARRSAASGAALLRADPMLAALALLLGTFVVLGAMVNVVEVFLIRDTLGSSSTWYGVVGGLWGAGLLAGSLLGGRATGSTTLARLLVAAAMVLSAALIGYAVAPAVAWLVPAALVGGVANGVLNVALMALAMRRAPEAARGRIAATLTGLVSGALIGAYLLGGVLSVALTPREVFALSGLLALVAPLLFGRRLLRTAAETEPGEPPTSSEQQAAPVGA
jgi:MFS family permease